jgi:hypothetical protein
MSKQDSDKRLLQKSVNFYHNTLWHILQDINIFTRLCQNFKSGISIIEGVQIKAEPARRCIAAKCTTTLGRVGYFEKHNCMCIYV